MERYEILKRIGEGSAGAVYAARDTTTGESVALKVLKKLSADERLRFEREAEVLRRFDHLGIVKVIDAGVDRDVPFIAMELLSGGTLHSILKRKVQLSLRQVLTIAFKLGDALAYAHAHGVIHRDVKPANAFITRSSQIKLMDFGMARFVDTGGSMTAVNTFLGTPDFIAPEVVDGARPTPACDQYALGVMAYMMIGGASPFPGTTPMATMLARCEREATPLSELAPHVPAPVEAVVMLAIARDPARRHPDAEAFTAGLRSVIALAPPDGEP